MRFTISWESTILIFSKVLVRLYGERAIVCEVKRARWSRPRWWPILLRFCPAERNTVNPATAQDTLVIIDPWKLDKIFSCRDNASSITRRQLYIFNSPDIIRFLSFYMNVYFSLNNDDNKIAIIVNKINFNNLRELLTVNRLACSYNPLYNFYLTQVLLISSAVSITKCVIRTIKKF